jgi:hypothetical protein
MNFLHVFGMVVVEGEVEVPSWVPSVLLQQPQGDLLDQTDPLENKIIIICCLNSVQKVLHISYFQYENMYHLFLTTSYYGL